jgi:hypothetical protein
MSNFRPINRDMDFLMPPWVNDWLPEHHLARFIVEVIEKLDLRSMTGETRPWRSRTSVRRSCARSS